MDEWEAAVGLPEYRVPLTKDDAVRYLEMASEERRKRDAEECAEACVLLAQYAAHLTRTAQRAEAAAALLDDRITQLVRAEIPLQKAYSYQERRLLAVGASDEARALEGRRMAEAAKARLLAYYATRVERVATAYQNLSNVRRRGREFGE
jgi:hypothetical protein